MNFLMERDTAIEFINVSKVYKQSRRVKPKLIPLILGKNILPPKLVLNNISFSIYKGESVAIIGRNGMGKSTILKLLSGTSYPTSGKVITNGTIDSILDLNAGFDMGFTGRQNIYYKCQVLGLKKSDVDDIVDKIIEFSGISEFIDEPIRIYSNGMKARLGFSIMAFMDSDILAVDEVLSVGDFEFQIKCQDYISDFINDSNHTFVLVTHQCDTAKLLCKRGIWINNGKIEYDGDINICIDKYLESKNSK